jgi:hypothetical protein
MSECQWPEDDCICGTGDEVPIPADLVKREALLNEAQVTAEERAAIDQWCYGEQRKRARGVLLNDEENHV